MEKVCNTVTVTGKVCLHYVVIFLNFTPKTDAETQTVGIGQGPPVKNSLRTKKQSNIDILVHFFDPAEIV